MNLKFPELHMGGFRDGGWQFLTFGSRVWQEPKANTNAAYKICGLAYKILKV
jgi:hypothetical protein